MDPARDLPLFLALIALVGLSIVLAAAEASILRVNRVQVEVRSEQGSRRAGQLLSLLDDLPNTLSSVLLAVLLVQIGAATATGVLTDRLFNTIGVTIGSIVLTVVLFVYAEAIPKTYAVRHPVAVSLNLSWLVRLISVVLWPFVAVLVWFADLQTPDKGVTSTALDEAELLRLAMESEQAGVIDTTDRRLMEAGFRFGDMRVDEILVPRTDVVAVAEQDTVGVALDRAVVTGHRRLPVYAGSLDQIIGVVRLRELARAGQRSPSERVSTLTRPILTVPETKRVVELLSEMQQDRLHLAVVIDEYGGTAGIVTIEDAVEEVLGQVADEDEPIRPLVRIAGDRRWRVAGGCRVDELEHALGIDLPSGDWHTVAGLIIGTAGRIPRTGEHFEIADVQFLVTEATETRVGQVTVWT